MARRRNCGWEKGNGLEKVEEGSEGIDWESLIEMMEFSSRSESSQFIPPRLHISFPVQITPKTTKNLLLRLKLFMIPANISISDAPAVIPRKNSRKSNKSESP
jgi:hypothetical protein